MNVQVVKLSSMDSRGQRIIYLVKKPLAAFLLKRKKSKPTSNELGG